MKINCCSGDDVRQTRGTHNVSLYNRQDSIDSSQVGIYIAVLLMSLMLTMRLSKRRSI